MNRRQLDKLEMKMPENGNGFTEKCKWWKGMRGMKQWAMQARVSGMKEWAMQARVNGNLGNGKLEREEAETTKIVTDKK